MKQELFDLSGRVAIVTGGNGGIGLGMARGLAANGAAIAIVGRNEAKSAEAVADLAKDGHKAIAIAADVTDQAAVTAMVERVRRELGRIDILVNNAGINIRKPPHVVSLAEWDSVAPAYAASKGGIVQFTRSCAVAWAADNIQVNAVLPGWIDTELTQRAREQVDGLHDKVLARTPAARWGEPSDFAGIAAFLASGASDFVTGTAIPVDGGFSVMG